MERQFVMDLVETERISQDKLWRTGRPNERQYAFSAPHILLLEQKISKLRSLWYESKSEDLKTEFVKIAALAIRALEEVQ